MTQPLDTHPVSGVDDGVAVRTWLERTLPVGWTALVREGRSPGSATLYPELDVDAWMTALFDTRFLTADWPVAYGGLGLGNAETKAIYQELARYEVPMPLWANPLIMCGRAILSSGTAEQRLQFLPRMASGADIWCQLFSEPGAGSDLASLRTRAVKYGDRWLVTGEKVWTTFAHLSKWGMLLARTDQTASRHHGITCFIVDMATDGIEVRPLRQLTGETSFNQVFFDEAPVPDEYRLGPIDGGWEVAMRMLESERSILSTQRVGGIDVHRLLDRHAGERNPVVRQQLVHAYVRQRLSEFATAPEGRRVGRTLR